MKQSSVLVKKFSTVNYSLILILLLALTLLFFHRLAFSGLILGRGDVYAYFYPYWQVRNAAFMNGQLPLWSPDIFMGVPLLANSQLGTFYPPNWPLAPFDPPTGITISLLAHVVWALLGAYWLARRAARLDALPALLAAVLFGLGGYMGAKAENINQFQALAWLPWIVGIFHQAAGARVSLHRLILLAAALALQTLAGHPQTVFITLVGLAVYGVITAVQPAATPGRRIRHALRPLFILAAAGVIVLLLALPQLVPTLELMGGSNRSGGLNPQQAMAFSLNPLIIGRGLLPSYDGLVFGEYVAYMGVIGLGLALVGAFSPAATRRLAWIGLAAAGFGLALGVYNPLYWPLANLPGFSFFRVPARWLALFALAMALLAGMGLQVLKDGARPRGWVLALIAAVTGGLALGTRLTDQIAVDVIGPAVPTAATTAAWAAALAVLVGSLMMIRRAGARQAATRQRIMIPLLGAAAVLELFLASGVLAYNEVVPPDTYTAQRFTISQLRAYGETQTPPGRVLSISGLQFDPGDADTLIARYRELGLSDLAVRIALVDTKMRETLAANLPLVWGVPSIDGFDGGVLPTGWYTQFTSLLLPPGELRTIDGRLREILAREECRGACLPDQRWLNLTNTRYLITDKVYDLWYEDVAYDTQFSFNLAAGDTITLDELPPFEADAIDILYDCGAAACRVPVMTVTGANGQMQTTEPAGDENTVDQFRRARRRLAAPDTITQLVIRADVPLALAAVTLVDTRAAVFQPVTLGDWRRVLSSDIKLYENRAVLPRALIVHEVITVPDTWQGSEDALIIMRDPAFDPAQTLILAAEDSLNPIPAGGTGAASITAYTGTRVEIRAQADQAGYLLLTDAYYPGWTAAVNGQPAPVYRADVMFRAVPVPSGDSTIVLEFRPGWYPGVLLLGGAAWLLAAGGWLVPGWRNSRHPTP